MGEGGEEVEEGVSRGGGRVFSFQHSVFVFPSFRHHFGIFSITLTRKVYRVSTKKIQRHYIKCKMLVCFIYKGQRASFIRGYQFHN